MSIVYNDLDSDFHVYYSGFQIEEKDHPTPFVIGTRDESIEYDNSGFKRNFENNGAVVEYDSSLKKNVAVFDGSSSYMVCQDQTFKAATSGLTVEALVNIDSASYGCAMCCADSGGFEVLYYTNVVELYANSKYNAAGSLSDYGNWHHVAFTFDGNLEKAYIDGVLSATTTVGNYPITYHPTNYLFVGCEANGQSPGTRKAMRISYLRMYSTALSADDIKKECETSQLIDKGDGIEARDILETGDNIAFCVDDGIASKTWGSEIGISPEGSTTVNGTNGLTSFAQANCQVTLTDDGYRIYRTPNIVYDSTKWGGGTSSWGGFKWQPFAYSADLIQKDHSYVIMFHVHGFTDNAMSESPLVWQNNMGWSGRGLNPAPTNESRHTVPANFNGDMECYYAFTVSDDIYKTCTTSYASYVAGTKYLSYRDFCAGFGYSSTGTNGTDIYITNFRMYDVTGWTDDKVQMLKNGTLEALSVSEDDSLGNDSPVAIYKDGNVSAKRIKTF